MSSGSRILIAVAACVAVLVAGAWWRGVEWSDVTHWGTPRNVLETSTGDARIPVADGPAERLLPEVPVATSGSYDFLFPSEGAGGGPVRFDPCRPVEWTLNLTLMPDGAEPLVHDAIARVQEATGLRFDYLGTTTEPASFSRDVIQDRYDGGYAPLVIGFQNETQNPSLAGSVTGLGGSSAVPGAYGADRYLRAGVLILDFEDLAAILADPDGGAALAEAVIAHELGHVVGLAHVLDTHELMHESNLRLLDWGPGDLQGLAIAGAGGCEPG
ncbi:hypothetical protein QQX10_03890 [Demequina sp. SYSU T00039]|uniref:Peptidase n=1 Tax=Demequina lignilytica TaxID=3051663 RepID=A0AAW7M7X3_9MICO|nr:MULTISPECIES: hypothetical protein [unclassified Demequina]MDN4477132.1 hypothetical protein [Demequina sp. SYSU T00039-1]MDN4487305.1 hypothetical protein [Demequina sp. SYSU T00039]MDN4491556.1 hypothetical protein [Demequina sp. SYSU T00068]